MIALLTIPDENGAARQLVAKWSVTAWRREPEHQVDPDVRRHRTLLPSPVRAEAATTGTPRSLQAASSSSNGRTLAVHSDGFATAPHDVFVALESIQRTVSVGQRFDVERRQLVRDIGDLNVEATVLRAHYPRVELLVLFADVAGAEEVVGAA